MAFKAGMHGVTGGLFSMMNGGDFASGFASGAISSIVSSAILGAQSGFKANAEVNPIAGSKGLTKAIVIASGGLSGGLSSAIAGGNFWDGVKQGLITSGLNHLAHAWVERGPPKEGSPKKQRNQKAGSDLDNWLSKAKTALSMFSMWATGTRLPFGIGSYYDNDVVANSFRDADVVNQARDYWYNKVNLGDKTIYDGLTNFKGETRIGGGNFGFMGIWNAGFDPIEQFVGSFTPGITSNGEALTFTIQNNTSFKSFSYGKGPAWHSGPAGNFRQTYIFTEPINFNRIK